MVSCTTTWFIVQITDFLPIADLLTAFTTTLLQFYLASGIKMLWILQFSASRALLTKCADEDEVGKIFSVIAFLAALMPILGNPMYRALYNATIDTFPSAYFLFSASIVSVICFACFFVYTRRREMLFDRRGARINVREEELRRVKE